MECPYKDEKENDCKHKKDGECKKDNAKSNDNENELVKKSKGLGKKIKEYFIDDTLKDINKLTSMKKKEDEDNE